MAFTFSVANWEKARPSAAKGSGVAKGIKAVNTAVKKPVASMNEAECDAAKAALDQLVTAFDTASGKLHGLRDKKAVAASASITGWRRECTDALDEIRRRVYAIHRDKFVAEYNRTYAPLRDTLVEAHAAARNARAGLARGVVPDNKTLTHWSDAARDVSKVLTKTFFAKLHVDGVPKGSISVQDVPLPPDTNASKAMVRELNTWLDEFIKAAKKSAKAGGAGLADTDAVEKELKGMLDEYTKIDKAMKVLLQRAKQVAPLAKQKADAMKALVASGDTDPKKITPIVNDLKEIKDEAERLDANLRAINDPYRDNGGALAVRARNWRKMPGYDKARHEPILARRQEVAFLAIRQATKPITEARTQVQRAKELMGRSTNHRGYASPL